MLGVRAALRLQPRHPRLASPHSLPAPTRPALAPPTGQALRGSRLVSSCSIGGMRGLSALARRAAQARQVMVVRGGGGGPLAKPLPPSQALMEEDEL